MKTQLIFPILLCGALALAQTPGTITKPESGQTSYTIDNGESDLLEATSLIDLKAGVHIKAGADFTARIVDPGAEVPLDYTSYSLNDRNYVRTRTYQAPMASFAPVHERDVLESVTYFDGLGRPGQQVGIKMSGLLSNDVPRDLVTHIGYDSFGRMHRDWLPAPASGNDAVGSFRATADSYTRGWYKTNYGTDFPTMTVSTANAYSEKEFEASPLNRVLKQAAPGEAWKMGGGHEIGFAHGANTHDTGNVAKPENDNVRLFEVTTSFTDNTYVPTLQNATSTTLQYYGPGELYKTVTRDENHASTGKLHTTEEFVDKQGRTVLKRTYADVTNGDGSVSEAEPHDTYYVHDSYGKLTYVIPPKVDTSDGVSASELANLCYQYTYDHRNRLVIKKQPGKGEQHIVYDKLDRPIMAQDANLRTDGMWLFTRYDAHGRVAYTGKIASTDDRAHHQEGTDGTTGDLWASPSATVNTVGDTQVYYTDSGYPQPANTDVLYTVNYYDRYVDMDGIALPTGKVLDQDLITNVAGLPTVAKTKVLGTSGWTTVVKGYDKKGRAIWNASKNTYLATMDVVSTQLDFGGKALKMVSSHTKGTNTPIVVTDVFDHDHAGRLLKHRQRIGDGPMEMLARNTYDGLGKLVEKKVGNSAQNPLQVLNFGYNTRGWLKAINDPAQLQKPNEPKDLFAFGINYNTVTENASRASALYNGNISETFWKTANDDTKRSYSYQYDALNRLTAGYASSGNYNLLDVSYDKMGNIMSLNRKGHIVDMPDIDVATDFGDIDKLVYHYDNGNKLLKVVDNGNDVYGFRDGTNTNDDFEYDINGNLIIDRNKGITGVSYNHLNLPVQVDFGDDNIKYVYDAKGVKLKRTASTGTETIYAEGFVYEGSLGNAQLQFFGQPEGYIAPEGDGWRYVYQHKDHLGNIRLSYTEDPNGGLEIVEESNYYPFGAKMRGFNGGTSALGNDVAQRWKFGGKEYDQTFDINTYDFGARNYDPYLGRWMNIDPLAEQMRRHSPYNYAFDNPIYFIDPDGMMAFGSIDPPEWLKRAARKTSSLIKNTSAKLVKYLDDKRFETTVHLITTTVDASGNIIENAAECNIEFESFVKLSFGARGTASFKGLAGVYVNAGSV
ncbi:MAG: DUF6443 domain-containing protein, partial [Flavobacteriaceae bacterium]